MAASTQAASAQADSAVESGACPWSCATDAIRVLTAKIDKREASLTPDNIEYYPEFMYLEILQTIKYLKEARRLIIVHGPNARAILESDLARHERDTILRHGNIVRREEFFIIDKVLDMMPASVAASVGSAASAAAAPSAQCHQGTTYDFIDRLVVDDRQTVVAVGLDDTLITSIESAVNQLMAMTGLALHRQISAFVEETIATSDLQKVTDFPDTVVPINLDRLAKYNALDNVKVVVITKRNPEGLAEITPLLRSILPGVEIIGTINADGETVKKSVVMRDLARATGAEVLHFADDSEPHRQDVEHEFQNDQIELHIYEVDLKAQLIAPAVAQLTQMA
jgi:hypothetical protein